MWHVYNYVSVDNFIPSIYPLGHNILAGTFFPAQKVERFCWADTSEERHGDPKTLSRDPILCMSTKFAGYKPDILHFHDVCVHGHTMTFLRRRKKKSPHL